MESVIVLSLISTNIESSTFSWTPEQSSTLIIGLLVSCMPYPNAALALRVLLQGFVLGRLCFKHFKLLRRSIKYHWNTHEELGFSLSLKDKKIGNA